MREREISLINLVYEFKRKLKTILIVGLIFAVLLVAYGWYKAGKQAAVAQYGAVCGITVNDPDVADDEAASPEKNTGIILGDAVINAVCEEYNASHSEAEAIDAEGTRAGIYAISSEDGNMVKIYTLADNQEKSQALNELVAAYTISVMDDEGIEAKLVQKPKSIGTVSVSSTEDSSRIDGYSYSVSAAPVATFGVKSIVKNGLIGFVIGIIIAYLCVCIIYIVKGLAVYPGDIKDAGIEYFGTLGQGEETDRICWEKALIGVALAGKAAENDRPGEFGKSEENGVSEKYAESVIALGCGCDPVCEGYEDLWNNEGIEFVKGEDVIVKPMAKLKAKDAGTAILLVKSGAMKVEDLYKLAKELNEGANGVVGAILVV